MRDEDVEAICAAYAALDEAALDRASRAAGLELTLPLLGALAARIRPPLSLPHVLRTLDDARVAASGLAVLELRGTVELPRGAWATKTVCLAVRDGDAIVVGIDWLRTAAQTPADAWPALRPWFKQLAKNRARAAGWAQESAYGRVRIPIVAAPLAPTGPSIDEATLLQTIVEHPDDLDARSVLADRLLEREDPRGELVRLDLEQRRFGLTDAARKPLVARERSLVAMHRTRLAGEVAELAADYEIAGGFVDHVTMTASAFRKHGARLFRASPIRTLTPRPWNDAAVKTLATTPHVALVRELRLVGAVGVERRVQVAPLCAQRFDRLESLVLDGTMVVGDDAERFLQTLVAPRLRALSVRSTVLGGGAIRGLAANPALCTTLEEISMVSLEHPLRSSMRSLETKADSIAVTGIDALALPALRTLSLYQCWFASDARIATLVSRSPRLELVQVEVAGAMTYAALARCLCLRSLDLHVAPTREALADLLALPALTHLTFDTDGWTPAQLTAIADALLAVPASHPLCYVYFPGRHARRLRERFSGEPLYLGPSAV